MNGDCNNVVIIPCTFFKPSLIIGTNEMNQIPTLSITNPKRKLPSVDVCFDGIYLFTRHFFHTFQKIFSCSKENMKNTTSIVSIWWFLLLQCWYGKTYKIGAPLPPVILTDSHHSKPLNNAGYDERFDDIENTHQEVDTIRRFLDIQQKIQTLENSKINLETRALLAKNWLEMDRIRAPNITLQLSQQMMPYDDPEFHNDDA